MKKILTFSLFLFLSWQGSAQFGFYMGAQTMSATKWESILNNSFPNHQTSIFQPTTYLAGELVFYSGKKGYRVSSKLFLSRYLTTVNNPSHTHFNPSQSNFEIMFLGFSANFDWYVLNYNTSYKVSTFSQEEHWLKKGLFFRFSPGITITPYSYRSNSRSLFNDLFQETNDQENNLSLEAGMGIDFGISELITVTPIFSYTHMRKVYWKNFGLTPDERRGSYSYNTFVSNVHHFQLAVRLAFKFQTLKKPRT